MLPPNPLVGPFADVVEGAQTKAFGAFYQMSDPQGVGALIEAKRSGVDVRIATDAEFRDDAHYEESLESLESAGVPVSFDVTAAGSLLIEEAGGSISDFRGGPFDAFKETCAASNGHLHEPLLEVLRAAGAATVTG